MRLLVIAIVLAAVLVALFVVNKGRLDDVSQVSANMLKFPAGSSDPGNLQTFLFIETRTDKNGTLINGTQGSLFIDAPTYGLENSTLRTVEAIELNSSTKAVFGSEFEISGDIGSGVSSGLYPVVNLPYDYGEIHILKIEGDNVTLNCSGESISLTPGGSWKRVTTQPEEIGTRLFNMTTTVTVYNHGNASVHVNR